MRPADLTVGLDGQDAGEQVLIFMVHLGKVLGLDLVGEHGKHSSRRYSVTGSCSRGRHKQCVNGGLTWGESVVRATELALVGSEALSSASGPSEVFSQVIGAQSVAGMDVLNGMWHIHILLRR